MNFFWREGNRDELLGEYTSLTGEVASFPKVIKPYHEGNLECEAKVQNNKNIEPTLSNVHYLRVVGGSLYFQGYLIYCDIFFSQFVKFLLNVQIFTLEKQIVIFVWRS